MGNSDGELEMIISETQIAFKFDQTKIISRLIDGNYPAYNQIIPSSFSTNIVTSRQELISALKTSSVFMHGSSSVVLEYDNQIKEFTLNAESTDLGKSTATIKADIDGSTGKLILNYKYLLDCLLAIETEKVRLKIIVELS